MVLVMLYIKGILAIFTMTLVLTVGIINSSPAFSTPSIGSDSINKQLKEAIKKACPSSTSTITSNTNTEDLKDLLQQALKSCLLKNSGNLPSNGEATLLIDSHLRANNCSSFAPCPSPNGDINVIDYTLGKVIATLIPKQSNQDVITYFLNVPIGHEIKILAGKYPNLKSDYYEYDSASIINVYNGCSALAVEAQCLIPNIGSDGARIGVLWHYNCISFWCGSS